MLILLVIASLLSTPILAFQLLKTRRELRELRDLVHRRDVSGAALADAAQHAAPSSVARDSSAALREQAVQRDLEVMAIELERLSEGQRFLTKLLTERADTMRPSQSIRGDARDASPGTSTPA